MLGPLHKLNGIGRRLYHRVKITIEQLGNQIAIKDIEDKVLPTKEISHRLNNIAIALKEAGVIQDSVIGVFVSIIIVRLDM